MDRSATRDRPRDPTSNRPELEFWFEFASTYSYPAALRVEALAREAGVALSWKPFLLGPIFRAQGWNDSPFNVYPVKGRYMWRDLARICDKQEIPLRHPSQFPRNGLRAARVACVAAQEPWGPEFVRAVYGANFAEDRDIADAGVLSDILTGLGQPAAEVLARAEATENKERLRAQTERATEIGLFGAPSFVVGEEIFWGNDRLEDALAWARRD
jgi:2-hydroxychromene-2-carboxylate isomerase